MPSSTNDQLLIDTISRLKQVVNNLTETINANAIEISNLRVTLTEHHNKLNKIYAMLLEGNGAASIITRLALIEKQQSQTELLVKNSSDKLLEQKHTTDNKQFNIKLCIINAGMGALAAIIILAIQWIISHLQL